MASTHLRAIGSISRGLRATQRAFSTSASRYEASTSSSKTPATSIEQSKDISITQAPNRTEVWSKNQKPRVQAMTGPRFEQTDFSLQPQPMSAMELVHREPVRWTHKRMVACEGGGGPAGHPKIYINTDKPEICTCSYCGLPFANEHHRKHLESLPQTSYPLA